MSFTLKIIGVVSLLVIQAVAVQADPEQDRRAFIDHYQTIYPGLPLEAYADGVYAIDQDARESWEAIEAFPPYELAIEKGKIAFDQPFRNGKAYADCFPHQGQAIAQLYPQWNPTKGKVITLALALNECREANDEAPLPYSDGRIAELLAYMAQSSRGKPTSIVVPEQDPRALAAYEEGKHYYYQRRGQLNFACATCHVQNVGKQLRSEILSPSLGHTTHWPVYRLKWGETGSLHRRFAECHEQIRAPKPAEQSTDLRHLEYFLSFMSNGIPVNGPSTRK
ncbi:sulfur oxidation c-type cytochrome SoxA [Methylicorpusculum oleiharenae]|uniref:sulfur oxidation c-type cytochrome SoxA n=1 Tax=Methylicorpusculum oleiharenae TaxID=1338687 RepID=UPI0013567BB4|nr:sulfur oxidation c-type cytochrome SoxA [Methylicorpusculum oleiharenae]MCD2451031.1 sulfur oxidation c-type cytochrome SoxA [Methylicorpusculum oleiharenae]